MKLGWAMWSRRWVADETRSSQQPFGVPTYEEPCCTFYKGRVRRHRNRIRPDCSRHCACDHRRCAGRRNEDVQHFRQGLHGPEISCRELNQPKGSELFGALFVSFGCKWNCESQTFEPS